MDQLGVVTTVLVLSTVLTSLEDFKRLFRRIGWLRPRTGETQAGSSAKTPAGLAAPTIEKPQPLDPALTVTLDPPMEAVPQSDLVGALLDDLEADDERRVSRAMSMLDKVPATRVAPRLMQLLKHPKDDISGRAARALLALGQAESLEPLYLYFSTRALRAV